MKVVRVKVNIAGTTGEDAWLHMKHFEEVDPREEVFRVSCGHRPDEVHTAGESGEASLKFEDFVAEYAVAHYLKQPEVIDADVEPA